MAVADLIIKKIVTNKKQTEQQIRHRLAYAETIISVIVNTIMFIMKLVLGIMTQSISVIADAFHTLSDSVSSIVIWIGIKISGKSPDPEHPFGHERVEYITGIIVSISLIVVGIEFFKESMHRLTDPRPLTGTVWIVVVMLITILMKEWLARIAIGIGKYIRSDVILADAWHHRSDAISSVVALLAAVMQAAGYSRFDAYGGFIISAFIIYTGFDFAKGFIDSLVGKAPEEDLLNKIKNIASSHPAVKGMHDIIIHSYGNINAVSFHVELDQDMEFMEAHNISEEIEQKIIAIDKVSSVTVHIDPYTTDFGEFTDLPEHIKNIIATIPEITSYHDLRLLGEKNIRIDITIPDGLLDKKEQEVVEKLTSGFKKIYSDLEIGVKVEPAFHYQ